MRLNAILLFTLACTPIASGGDDIIALEVRSPSVVPIVVGDTLTLSAAAITANGNEAPGVQIIWSILDIDSGQVGFSLDTLSGFVRGQQAGEGRVQARVENLRSEALRITVTDTTPTPATR